MWLLESSIGGLELTLILFLNDYRLISQILGSTTSFFCVDFNYNFHYYVTSNAVKSFVDMCFEFSYLPVTNKPSRISGLFATAIDHILHNHFTFPMESGVFMSDTSDNFSPFVIDLSDETDIHSEESFFGYGNWDNMESVEFDILCLNR